jgi:DNA-directed RNA polymerase specialized sigma24 family protein
MRSDGHDGTGYRRWLARTVGGFRDDGFDADVAADLAGEVVLRLLQAEQAGRHITAPYWRCVMRSVKNDYLRRLSVTRATNERIIARINAEPAEDPEQRAVLHLWYEECLASLGADEAQIVRMHLEEQYTFEVISQTVS